MKRSALLLLTLVLILAAMGCSKNIPASSHSGYAWEWQNPLTEDNSLAADHSAAQSHRPSGVSGANDTQSIRMAKGQGVNNTGDGSGKDARVSDQSRPILTSAWAASGNKLYVAGAGLAGFEAGAFTNIPIAPGYIPALFHFASENAIYELAYLYDQDELTAKSLAVFKYDGAAWKKLAEAKVTDMSAPRAFWVANDTDFHIAIEETQWGYDDHENVVRQQLRMVMLRMKDGQLMTDRMNNAWNGAKTTVRRMMGFSGGNLWAVGETSIAEGLILHYDGSQWRRHETESTLGALKTLYGVADDDFYIGGKGVLLKYDGMRFIACALPPNRYVNTIWYRPGGHVYLSGTNGKPSTTQIIYTLAGTQLIGRVYVSLNQELALTGFGNDTLFAVASDGQIIKGIRR